jgi:polyisoprenoid-binding protein YceI
MEDQIMATSETPGAATLQAQLADGSLAGNWTLDPARSTATFASTSIWGLVKVKGVFPDLEGAGTVSPTGEASGHIAIATESLTTKNAKRDKHLRSADFFHSVKHPSITFTLDKITPAGEGAEISGSITVRDVSQPISFPATVTRTGDGGLLLDATVQVDRSVFGLTWNQLGMASMKNEITIHAAFTKS